MPLIKLILTYKHTLCLAFLALCCGFIPPVVAESNNSDRDRVETIIIGKFATELALTPAQAEQFYPRFRIYREQSDAIFQQQKERTHQLELLSQGGGDSESLGQLLDAQEKEQLQLAEVRRKFLLDIGAFLSPQQVSRTAIMLDEVPRKIRQFIQERNRPGAASGGEGDRDHTRRRRR